MKYEVLKNLISFNTIKDKDNEKIMNYIEKYLTEYGFKTEYKSKNLVMSIGEKPRLGFLGHTDTVEYIDEFKSPFELKEEGNLLYGLGVCDMKGGIAAMLDAITGIDFSKLKGGMKMYFTFDEEIGFGGTYELVKNMETFPETMIFGEPTNNETLIGGKGLLEYEIFFKGIKAHSSNPSKGISANMNAVYFLYELNEFYNSEIKTISDYVFDIPYTTMNVGLLNGGTAKNSVPSNAYCSIDFRTINKDDEKKINNKLDELCEKYLAEYKLIESISPFFNKIDFIESNKTANFMTEASLIEGCKKIILGTGPVTAHEVNEHISKESYDLLVEQYKKIILKCLNY